MNEWMSGPSCMGVFYAPLAFEAELKSSRSPRREISVQYKWPRRRQAMSSFWGCNLSSLDIHWASWWMANSDDHIHVLQGTPICRVTYRRLIHELLSRMACQTQTSSSLCCLTAPRPSTKPPVKSGNSLGQGHKAVHWKLHWEERSVMEEDS